MDQEHTGWKWSCPVSTPAAPGQWGDVSSLPAAPPTTSPLQLNHTTTTHGSPQSSHATLCRDILLLPAPAHLDLRLMTLRKSWSAPSITWSLATSMQPNRAPTNRPATPTTAHTAAWLAASARLARAVAPAEVHTHAVLSVKG